MAKGEWSVPQASTWITTLGSAMGEWSMPLTDHLGRFISLQQWVSGLCRYTDHHVGPYMSLQLQAMPVR